MAPFVSHVMVEPKRLQEAVCFYEKALGFQLIMDTGYVILFQVEGNSLTLIRGTSCNRVEVLQQDRIANLEVKNVKKAIKRAVAAGAETGPAKIDFVGEGFQVRRGEITDPFGYVWKLYEEDSLPKKLFIVYMGVMVAACLYAGVWRPYIQPVKENWEPHIQPLIREGVSVFKTYSSAKQRVTEMFSSAKETLKRLDAQAGENFGKILPDMDPSSSSNIYTSS